MGKHCRDIELPVHNNCLVSTDCNNYSFSFVFYQSVKVKVIQSCLTLCDPMDYTVHGILLGQNTGVGSLSLLQWIFLTQELNRGLLHFKQILYQLSYQGSPIEFIV